MLIKLLLFVQVSFASPTGINGIANQKDIDQAFKLIFNTRIGLGICRDILGADATAIAAHLGVSEKTSLELVRSCSSNFEPSDYVFSTSPQEIKKITPPNTSPRRYIFVKYNGGFPIESWTDAITNTTIILSPEVKISFPKLVQILAHETAVYFDSKTNPTYAGAQNIPQLRDIKFTDSTSELNPLIAISDPLFSHTLTYIRALQVEFSIIDELVDKGLLVAPEDYEDPALRYLVSDACGHQCIELLLTRLHSQYVRYSLPLLAFSSHYRAKAMIQLKQTSQTWSEEDRQIAKLSLETLPVEYLKDRVSGGVGTDIIKSFSNQHDLNSNQFKLVEKFMTNRWWNLEWPLVSKSRLASGQTLLEFMKQPLLSGYNIFISSGPRARIIGGVIE